MRLNYYCEMGVKSGKKRKIPNGKAPVNEEEEAVLPPTTRTSDEPPPKKSKWINKQRVLVFACRGISHRGRHLMEDLRTLMPHCRSENKMERRENLSVVNEMCEMRNCNKAVLFEGRLRRDLYMWLSNVPTGPSVKFLVENIYTMAELKLTGNCLKGTRPLLSFDNSFDETPHYQVLKELLIQIFGTPNGHPKSQPFIDHVLTFSILDNRIWFRNYQILAEDGALAEVGPRFVLNPIKIFENSFGGATLWENPDYISPAKYRRTVKKDSADRYINRITQKAHRELDRPEKTYDLNDIDDIFAGDAFEKATEIVEKEAVSATQETSNGVENKKKKKKTKKMNAPKIASSTKSMADGKPPVSAQKKIVPVVADNVKNAKSKKAAAIKVKKAKAKANKAKLGAL